MSQSPFRLQAENQSTGFGMPRWPQEQYDAALERATAAAADVWERYRQRLTWVEVTFGPSGTSVTPPSRSFECLVGRSEVLVVQINNHTRQPLSVEVNGQAGDTPIRASRTFVPPNSTECACVLVTVAAPGPFDVRLQCNAGALNTAVQCNGLAKPSCRLTIQLVDAATGKPTAARAFVRTEDGRYYVHDDRTVYLAGGKNIQKFGYEDSQFVAVVPPGPVQIKLQRGFEYELTERTEVVDADKTITMALTRWVDMPMLGWFSGDTHEHWVTTEWYENGDPDWLAARTQAGSQMTWWGHDDVAHTGPIYITAGDKRLIHPDAVDRLIEVVKAGRAAAARSNMYASEQQKAEVLKYFDEGIEKYQQLRRQTR